MDYPNSVPNVNLLNGKFTDGNPSAGVPASLDPSEWANLVTDELLNVLAAAGIAPSEAINNQLATAIQSCMLNTGGDSGGANAYACTFTPEITALTDGLKLSFQAAHANTGPSTLSVNGLPAAPILGGAHAALQGGEIVADGKIEVIWSAVLDAFVLLENTGGGVQVAAATQPQHAMQLGQSTGRLGGASFGASGGNPHNGAGDPGLSPGAGGAGGGSASAPAGTTAPGGAGGPGLCVIEEYS